MDYYLVIRETYFVDPHGSADHGGTIKKLVKGNEDGVNWFKSYNEFLNPPEEYNEDREYDEEGEIYFDGRCWTKIPGGSEDGYNSEYDEVSIEKITEEKYNHYKKIIEDYNSIRINN